MTHQSSSWYIPNGAIRIPRGTISERPDISDNHGLLRYNVEINRFEGYSEGKWRSLGRIEDADRDTYIITTNDETDDNDKLRFLLEISQEWL